MSRTIEDIVRKEASTMEFPLADDVIPVFIYAFSKLGTPDEYLQVALEKVSRGLHGSAKNEAKNRYVIKDILQLSMNAARDSKFNFVDGYIILLVIVFNFAGFLRHDLLGPIRPLPPYPVSPDEKRSDQIEYPAYRAIIEGYANLVESSKRRNEIQNYLFNHFKNSNIKILNMANVYNEILRIAPRAT